MNDFNLKKYLSNNPLLKEEKEIEEIRTSPTKKSTRRKRKGSIMSKINKKDNEKGVKEKEIEDKKVKDEYEEEYGIKPGTSKGTGRKGINTFDDYKLWEREGLDKATDILDAVHEFALEFGLGEVEYQEPIGDSIGGRAVINWDTGREGEIIGSEEEEIGISDHNEKMEYINNNPILKNSWSKLDSMDGEAAFWVTYPLTEYDQEEQAEIDMENRVGDEMTEGMFSHHGRTGFSLGRKPAHTKHQTDKEKWDAMHEDERMTFLHSHIKDPDEADSYLDSHIDELPNHVTAAL